MVVKIKFYNTGSFTKALVSSEGHTKLCQRSNLFQYLKQNSGNVQFLKTTD